MVETTKSSNVRDVMGPESPVAATFVAIRTRRRPPFPRLRRALRGRGRRRSPSISGSQHSRFGSTDWNTSEMGHSNMFLARRTLTTAEYLTSARRRARGSPSRSVFLARDVLVPPVREPSWVVKTRRRAETSYTVLQGDIRAADLVQNHAGRRISRGASPWSFPSETGEPVFRRDPRRFSSARCAPTAAGSPLGERIPGQRVILQVVN